MQDPATILRALFDTAVAAADPMEIVGPALPPRPAGRIFVTGAGKASARMAEALEAAWGPLEGLVITRHGHARPTRGIEIVEAAHPIPDAAGATATARILATLETLGPDDTVIALISGGGSALMVAPAGEITLEEKQAVNAALLASGASIDQMNCVRKHLSRVKGGQLAAAAYPARLVALLISDVPGDDPAHIASGPTVGDASTSADAGAILDRYRIAVPPSVTAVLSGETGVIPPGDPRLSKTETHVIAAPARSLDAAAAAAREMGLDPVIVSDRLEGEARDVGTTLAQDALVAQSDLRRGDRPKVFLSGGECTVTGSGGGIGGPNAECALAMAIALNREPNVHAIMCDTDGIDGAAEVAGAIIGPDTLVRAAKAGWEPREALARNDAHSFFADIGAQVVTGPTLTNVNDFRAVLVYPV